jgi:two-component system, chemotaxis family, protein-glutamate methylesterase/glutaminase
MGSNVEGAGQYVLLIGGSAGSFEPLRQILRALPVSLPATVFVLVHLGPAQAQPTVLIANHTALAVKLAKDGLAFSPGEVYIAPADHHLAFDRGVMRVYRGPRENGARPSVDVLFRSAAVNYGSSVVAVVLSGALHDGSLGLQAVERCGGVTIVQAPEDAANAAMPTNALRATSVDHCAPAAAIPALLEQIMARPHRESPPAPKDLQLEARAALMAADPHQPVEVIGEPLPIACPDCGGALSQVKHADSYSYRCHVGHAYSPAAMLTQHGLVLERALWVAYRTVKERVILMGKMAEDARASGSPSAGGFEARVRELEAHAASIHEAIFILVEPALDQQAQATGI